MKQPPQDRQLKPREVIRAPLAPRPAAALPTPIAPKIRTPKEKP